MKRRAAQDARAKSEKATTFYEIVYLLGVYDQSRMGALRIKTDLNGPFLDNDEHSPTPLRSSLGDLQEAVNQLENGLLFLLLLVIHKVAQDLRLMY